MIRLIAQTNLSSPIRRARDFFVSDISAASQKLIQNTSAVVRLLDEPQFVSNWS